MADVDGSRPCHAGCWLGFLRLLRLQGPHGELAFDDSQQRWAKPDRSKDGSLEYKDRHEAMAEVILEGGEGDAIYFLKVKPGSQAEQAGVRPGDELLQVNFTDPKILFWRPAEEILPAIFGPVLLRWRPRPPQKLGERTRINSKPIKLKWHDDEDEDEEVQAEYPKSRAQALDDGEWLCGSCEATNFDSQEYCRRCGLRDSRLPKRPGAAPKRSLDVRKGSAQVSFGTVDVSKKDMQEAAIAGMKQVGDPLGMGQQKRDPAPKVRRAK